ncbi:MAG: hypothetical protein WCG90_08225 [Chitinophagia bacterium]
MDNYEKTIIPAKVEAEIGNKIRETYDRLDKDIEEVTGLKKGPHEKTYDFNKRVLAKLKADAAAGTGGDDVLRQQLEQAQKQLEERKDYVPKSELEKLQSQYFTKEVNGRVHAAIGKHVIAVPAHITDEAAKKQYADSQARFIAGDFLSRFTAKADAEGNLTFFEGDKLLTDTKTAKPITEAQLIEQHYGAYFTPTKAPGKGAGSGKGDGGSGTDAAEADLKTKEDVANYLSKKGLVIGDRAFNDEYKRILTEQGITA